MTQAGSGPCFEQEVGLQAAEACCNKSPHHQVTHIVHGAILTSRWDSSNIQLLKHTASVLAIKTQKQMPTAIPKWSLGTTGETQGLSTEL